MSSTNSFLMMVVSGCLAATALALPTLSNDDSLIRFYTDSGNVVEIENRAFENAQNSVTDLGLFREKSISAAISAMPSANTGELVPGTSVSNDNNRHQIVTRGGQRFCGESLINALALVCRGNYHKRNQLHSTSDEMDYPFNAHGKSIEQTSTENGNPTWEEVIHVLKNVGSLYRPSPSSSTGPFAVYMQGYNSANNHDLAKVRLKRGVVDECCKKPCSHTQMSQYCSRHKTSKN